MLLKLAVILSLFSPADTVIHRIPEAGITIDLPNDQWHLADRKKNDHVTVYIFKREPVEDGEGRQIIPNIAVIIEDVGNEEDVIDYSIKKRIATPFEIIDVLTYDKGSLTFKNAIGYKGVYTDKSLEHFVYIVHAINEQKGIQIIMDVTTNIVEKVEPEFLQCLKSIRK